MTVGLLFGHDDAIAKWAFETWGLQTQMKFDRAIGLIDNKNGSLVGAVVFQCWNGTNVELSYYGLKPTLSLGVVRCLARDILFTFNVSRVTVSTSRKNRGLMRSLQRLGFKLEGAQRRFYGNRDCNRNTAIRFVLFREALEKFAAFPAKKERQTC